MIAVPTDIVLFSIEYHDVNPTLLSKAERLKKSTSTFNNHADKAPIAKDQFLFELESLQDLRGLAVIALSKENTGVEAYLESFADRLDAGGNITVAEQAVLDLARLCISAVL